MFSLSLFSQFFVQTYKNIIFGTYASDIYLFLILFVMTLNPFLLMVNHALASIPPHSLFSLSLPSLSHIFLDFFIFGYFLINWRIYDIYSTHGCNTCMPAGLVAEFFFYWSLEKRINYHIHKYIYIWGLQFRSGICSANVLGEKIGNFVRVDIIINMQT